MRVRSIRASRLKFNDQSILCVGCFISDPYGWLEYRQDCQVQLVGNLGCDILPEWERAMQSVASRRSSSETIS